MPLTPQEIENMMAGGRQAIPAYCLYCGYDMRGAVSDRCPECGLYLTGKDCRERADFLRRQMRAAMEARKAQRPAIAIAAASVVAGALLLVTAGSCVGLILRVSALIGGAAGAFLGVGAFRVQQLPAWMRTQGLIDPPRYSLAVSAILLGLLGAGLAIVL